MIILVFALKIEADPFIKELGLKKIHNISKVRVYKKDDIVAVITGTGIINTSSNLSFLLSKYYDDKNDVVINIGIAGGCEKSNIGDAFLINKIIGVDGDEYFPDVDNQGFEEATLKTVLKSEIKNKKYSDYIQDMEGEAVYSVAQNYVYQNNIHLIKIISDLKDTDYIDRSTVLKILNKNKNKIFEYIEYRLEESNKNKNLEKILSKEESILIEEVSERLKLSVYLKNEFRKKCVDYKIRKNNLIKLLKKYDNLNVSNKVDRGNYYDEIKSELETYKI